MVKKQQRKEEGCNRVGSSGIDPDWNRVILEEKPWKMVELFKGAYMYVWIVDEDGRWNRENWERIFG